MGYTVHPTGLYEHIARASQLGLPMYVTETGAADKSPGEKARLACVESYFDQCMKAVRDGFDVRGFYYWTLVDNFEWNCGRLMKFGLYSWTKEEGRQLREGGRLLARIYASVPADIGELRDHLEARCSRCGCGCGSLTRAAGVGIRVSPLTLAPPCRRRTL